MGKYQCGYLFKHCQKTFPPAKNFVSPFLVWSEVSYSCVEAAGEQTPTFPSLYEQGWMRPLVLVPTSSVPAVAEGWLFTNTTLISFCPVPQLQLCGTHRMRPALTQDHHQRDWEDQLSRVASLKEHPNRPLQPLDGDQGPALICASHASKKQLHHFALSTRQDGNQKSSWKTGR